MPKRLETFYQLAYEAAMRGRNECRRQSSEGEQEEGSEGVREGEERRNGGNSVVWSRR
ncbi:MAG: hypothetical protein II001_05910 [Bacteroidales bacterium]|nr:hypothetical protein [Bacteroidales bacterium]